MLVPEMPASEFVNIKPPDALAVAAVSQSAKASSILHSHTQYPIPWSSRIVSVIFTVQVASSSAESLSCFITRAQIAQKRHKPANYPHKLAKTAEPWLGGGAAFGRLELHARVTSAAVRSCRCALVAAAAAPLSGAGTGGGFCSLE